MWKTAMSAGEIPAAVLSLCSGSSVKDQVSQITFALLDGGGKKEKKKEYSAFKNMIYHTGRYNRLHSSVVRALVL